MRYRPLARRALDGERRNRVSEPSQGMTVTSSLSPFGVIPAQALK
jgi:hypothetical protein